jgi:hypothetical protein
VSSQPTRERRVFSQRLDDFLESLHEGETPNSGTFCGFCYNPIPPGQTACDHCGRSLIETPPVYTVPDEVLAMHRRKQRRESLVVNSFAYLGLGMGLCLFLLIVSLNFFFFGNTLWLLIFSIFVLLVGGRMLAGIVGGVIGDEVGFRYANRHLAAEWDVYVRQRESRAGGRT